MSKTKALDLSEIADLYTGNIHQHGVASKAVGWPDAQSHALRFKSLSYLLPSGGKEFSVNDLGCGYGAYLEYLNDEGYPVSFFRGYEISDAMLEEARRRNYVANAEWMSGARLDKAADYSLASGIFNVRLENDEETWREYVLNTLNNLHEFSRLGFAFNLLSTYVDWREDHLYYGDPLFYFDYCKRHFAKPVTLLHDYPLWEWTLIVRR
jgi:SAM-dependent methyltransferase